MRGGWHRGRHHRPVLTAIPAFVNPQAGSADKARTALVAAPAFALREVEPEALARDLRAAVESRVSRVLVSGGDGTLATAAGALAGTGTAMAVLPGGTLNHFARDLGIPTDAEPALALAATGEAAPVDVAYVNDRLFLNTSSLGAYVRFVRLREELEERFGYRVASLLAFVRTLRHMRGYRVTLEVEGVQRTYRTIVVFIGVGERELRLPTLGGRAKEGQRGLHLLVVRGGPVRQLVGVAVMALFRGLGVASRSQWLDSFVVDSCRIDPPRRDLSVAVDGELVTLEAPLEYRLARDALLVVQPAPAAEGKNGATPAG